MVALTQDRKSQRRDGDQFSDGVVTGQKIFLGSLVCLNGNGFARPAADTAGYRIRGVALEQVDNTSGSNGDKTVTTRKGVYLFEASGLTIADLGEPMYVVDDQTVSKAATTNNIHAGILVGIEGASKAWIDVGSRAGGSVASVSIADAPVQTGAYVQADVEAIRALSNGNKVAINAILSALRNANIIGS